MELAEHTDNVDLRSGTAFLPHCFLSVPQSDYFPRGFLLANRGTPNIILSTPCLIFLRLISRTPGNYAFVAIKIRWELFDEPLVVLCDRVQLVQVFFNVMKNAVQSMPDRGVLGLSPVITENEWICVFVIDTRVGIPDENLDKIFEPT